MFKNTISTIIAIVVLVGGYFLYDYIQELKNAKIDAEISAQNAEAREDNTRQVLDGVHARLSFVAKRGEDLKSDNDSLNTIIESKNQQIRDISKINTRYRITNQQATKTVNEMQELIDQYEADSLDIVPYQIKKEYYYIVGRFEIKPPFTYYLDTLELKDELTIINAYNEDTYQIETFVENKSPYLKFDKDDINVINKYPPLMFKDESSIKWWHWMLGGFGAGYILK